MALVAHRSLAHLTRAGWLWKTPAAQGPMALLHIFHARSLHLCFASHTTRARGKIPGDL